METLIFIIAIIGTIALSISAVFNELAAKILFWLYVTIAFSGICYSIFIIIDGFYVTYDDFARIIVSLTILIIPAVLQIKSKCKKWVKALLYMGQILICFIASLSVLLSPLLDGPRPLSRSDIEKQTLVKMPKYKIVEFVCHHRGITSDCTGSQTLKIRGDGTKFYRDLDSLSSVAGSGWSRDYNGYVFSNFRMDKEHLDKSKYTYWSFDMRIDQTDDKVYIEFMNI